MSEMTAQAHTHTHTQKEGETARPPAPPTDREGVAVLARESDSAGKS